MQSSPSAQEIPAILMGPCDGKISWLCRIAENHPTKQQKWQHVPSTSNYGNSEQINAIFKPRAEPPPGKPWLIPAAG